GSLLRVWPGGSGPDVYGVTRRVGPTRTAPRPLSLWAGTAASMQKFLRPRSAGRMLASLGSFGHALRRSRNSTATAPPGPAATDGWNWSVGTPVSTLSFTTTGAVHVKPPSVDCVNFTSACVPSQSSYVRYRWSGYVGL